ncbi:MAG: hypothetical protein ISEC1_P0433 [Thiomicrorhabdus sp.]|nr:MAG: hypothetical protein ISEC1_P0433 [Thiomicrorhabdus sp.]
MNLSSIQEEVKKLFYIYPSYRAEVNRALRTLLALGIVMLVIITLPSLPSMQAFKDYLPVHITIETTSVVFALLIFVVGWNAYSNKISANILLLSVVFFAAALLDFSHILSYPGMPDYITPAGTEKAINFWLSARFIVAGGLLFIALFTLTPLQKNASRYPILILMMILVGLVHWIILFKDYLLPSTFIEGQGLTAFKVNSEYLLIGLNILTGFILLLRMRTAQSYCAVSIFTAVFIMAMSEFFFTLYADVTDIYNLAGHVYKVIAYYFIYKAIFVTTVQKPYKQLDESRKQLNTQNRLFSSIVNNIPNMVFLKDAKEFRFVFFNKAGEKLLGVSSQQILGKNDYDLVSREQAEFLISKDRETLQSDQVIEVQQERIKTVNGERILHTKKVAINDDNGQPEYLLGISEDITEMVKSAEALRNSERSLRASQSIAGIGSYIFDLKNMLWSCSDKLNKIFGIDESYEVSAKSWVRLIHPADRTMVKNHFRYDVMKKGEEFNQEYRIIRRNDQSVVWVYGVGRLEYDEAGQPSKMVGTIQDITKGKKTSESLTTLSLAVEQSPNSIVITDLDGKIEYVNDKFTKVTGYSKAEALGQNPRILKSGKIEPVIYEQMWKALCAGKVWQGELVNRRKDHSFYIESVTISPVKQPGGTITNYVAIKVDITEQKQLQKHIQKLAHFDQLTGLPNRVLLNDRVAYLLSHAKRSNEQIAVMFLDLDNFKKINDTLGHNVGDKILIEMAKRLKKLVRSEDTVSRLGGDEFVLVFSNTDENSALHIAHKIINTISKVSQVEQYELTVTASIGIALYPHDGEDFDTLLKNADAAMYQVKKTTRNRSQFFTEKMNAQSVRSLELTNALHLALKNGELEVYYQPQSRIEDGTTLGAEALLRWKHPEMGYISPAEFIPIAEESGLIIEIGEWVLKTVMAQIKAWKASDLADMVVAVNLSAIQFRQEHFAEKLVKMIDESGVPYESLELELTEAVAMHDAKYIIGIMNELHENGISIAIDDFGTGYSSLSYLKQFNANKLKIDQAFIRELSTSSDDRAIVSAIIDMASNLGMKTIAEGVETSEQLAFLRMQGCDEIQGYYYSKAIPADEFAEYFKENYKKIESV